MDAIEKQCLECRWCKRDSVQRIVCVRPNEKTFEIFSCDKQRGSNWLANKMFDLCGKEGKYFEKK